MSCGCAEITFIPILYEANQPRVGWHRTVCPDDFRSILSRRSRAKQERAQFWREVAWYAGLAGWSAAVTWRSLDLSKPTQSGSCSQSWSSIIFNIFKYMYLVLKVWIPKSRKYELFILIYFTLLYFLILGCLVSHIVLGMIFFVQSIIFSRPRGVAYSF